jgi:Cytochrome P450
MRKKLSTSEVQKYDVNNNGAPKLKEAPGPKKKFIIGNLDALGGYEIPYQAFSALEQKYGKIIKLQLGFVPTMVINGVEAIKEVMVTKGHHFDSRPDFKRYHMLFSGNKENCKWFLHYTDERIDLIFFSSYFRSISVSILRLVRHSKVPPRHVDISHFPSQILC